MCKQVQSKRQAVRACLCAGFVSAAIFFALVWAGCGGGEDSGNPVKPPPVKEYTLTIEMDPADGGSVSCFPPNTKPYKDGDTVTLTAIARFGQKFTGWTGAQLPDTQTVTIIMDDNKKLTAHFKPFYILTVIANGGTVNKVPNKTEYVAGEQVILTAVPEPDYSFAYWSGASADTTNTANTVTVTIGGDTTMTAHFRPRYVYTLNVTKVPADGGAVNKVPDREKYENGEQVNITVVPDEGYKFTGWTGALEAATNAVTVTMDGNKTLIANFRSIYLTLQVKADPEIGGNVHYNNKTTYVEKEQVTLTATANPDYIFAGWSVSGVLTATTSPLTVTMDSSITLTANFRLKTSYTLAVNVEPPEGGTVYYTKKPGYDSGQQVALTAIAADGYTFTGWSGAAAAKTDLVTITMTKHDTLTAHFINNSVNCPSDPYFEGCPDYVACLNNLMPGCPLYVDTNPDPDPDTDSGCPSTQEGCP